ncbi:cupin domain-containing protein [Ulvibacterium sp.]|uniref:cupin domain-containing protein n=1 Tax=Ulvibacterium sp. TaxID=2665914 RepID=UPI00262433D6|nr:cupin domain-containing protein [Ulvibacterium sp.]
MAKVFTFLLCIGILVFSCRENGPRTIAVLTLVDTDQSWDGNKLPKYPEGPPQIKILKYTIPPQTKLPTHEHLVINAGVLLSGELTVVDENNNTLYLRAGDPIVELVNTFHYGKNEGTEPAEIIVFYAGAKDVPITVKKKTKN